jgi:hypothetical protein
MLQAITGRKARRTNEVPRANPGRAGSAWTDIQALVLRTRMALA